MKGFILGMLAETSIHSGAGQSLTGIDQPVAREATTGYPLIPGTSLKGALRGKFEQENLDQDKMLNEEEKQEKIIELLQIFGGEREKKGDKKSGNQKESVAGGVGITDARLLLLPIRTLTGHYRWTTCPYILERFQRDLRLVGQEFELSELNVEQETVKTGKEENTIFLEEFSFNTTVDSALIEKIVDHLKPLIANRKVKSRLKDQLVILNDDDFAHFVKHGLPIQARNHLEDGTKKSKNLWYEEALPPDTLLYSLILERPGHTGSALELLKKNLKDQEYLQVGGNETVGQGWMITSLLQGSEG